MDFNGEINLLTEINQDLSICHLPKKHYLCRRITIFYNYEKDGNMHL